MPENNGVITEAKLREMLDKFYDRQLAPRFQEINGDIKCVNDKLDKMADIPAKVERNTKDIDKLAGRDTIVGAIAAGIGIVGSVLAWLLSTIK